MTSLISEEASDRPTVRRHGQQRRAMAASLLAGVVGTTGLAATAPADAVDAGTTFYAQEIFAPDGPAAVTASCGGKTKIADMAAPTALPAGTTASVVVIGPYKGKKEYPLQSGKTCTVYKIGAVEVAALPGHKLAKGEPPVGGLVKAVTAASVTADGYTKLVAEKVVDRKRTARSADAEVELAYVADVTAMTTDTDPWTVKDKADVELNLNVTEAQIDDGLGSVVTAQFLTAPAPAD